MTGVFRKESRKTEQYRTVLLKRTVLYCSVFFVLLLLISCHPSLPSEVPIRLHDIWGLKILNDQNIDPADGAVLELFVAEEKFLLNVNLHHYQGQFRAGDSSILFSKINPSTSATSSSTEKELIQALKKVKRWKFENRFLDFYDRKNRLIARFVKMD